MKQEVLTRFPWPWLPSLALLIFFIFFLGLIVRLTMKSQVPTLNRAERLPLEDGDIYE